MMLRLRRDFLKLLSATLAIVQVPEFLLATVSSSDSFVICDDSGAPNTYLQNDLVESSPGILKLWQYGTDKFKAYHIPFTGHGMTQNPARPNEIAVFSKWGDEALILDLKEKSAVRIIKEDPGHRFFGHGVFSADGKKLFSSGHDDANSIGEIVVRDSKSLKVISRFSAFGRYAYDLQFNALKNELIIAVSSDYEDAANEEISTPHFSEETSLVYINASNGNFIKRLKIPEQGKSLLHFQQAEDGWIIAAGQANTKDTSSQKSYAIAISPSGKIKSMKFPDDFRGSFFGETLGITLFEKKSLAFVTNPSTKLIFIWNYKTQELLKYFYIPDRPKAIAITSDKKQVLITETKTKSLLRIDTEKMTNMGREKGSELSGYGAHMLRLKPF